MIADLLRLVSGEAAIRLQGALATFGLLVAAAALLAVALGFATAATAAALIPEIGAAWTYALIAGAYLAFGGAALGANAVGRRRRMTRQMMLARARAAATPSISPELMLVAAAAGALFTLGGKRARP